MNKEKKTITLQINGFKIMLLPEVYEPSDDTFLLLNTLNIKPREKILEIGAGCGIISLECARKGAHVICTDINPHAIELIQHNYRINRHLLKGTIRIRKGNLFSVLREGERFHTIIFNPPYLPTSSEERVNKWFDKATDGGKDGIEVTKKFIKKLRNYLSKNGRGYFVFSTLSNRSKLEKYLKEQGFNYEVVASRRFNFESIDIYQLTPTD